MLNFVIKYCENCMFCRAQVIIRGKTSHISWRHSIFLKSSRQRRWSSAISWRQNNGKMAERDRSHVIAVLQSLNTVWCTLVQLLHYILKCIYLEWRWLFGPFIYMLIKLFGWLSKLFASLVRNYFPKRPSGAPLHTLSKLYDVPVAFATPLFWGCVLLYLRSPKGGCCSISDDLSCSLYALLFSWSRPLTTHDRDLFPEILQSPCVNNRIDGRV